jgi:subtilase family serine protease
VYEGSVGAYGYAIPGFVGPGDAANVYDLTPLYASGIDGTGVTVAIVGASDISPSQLTAYWTTFGVNHGQTFMSITVPVVDGGSDPGETKDGNEDEAYLDTEVIGGLAPGAQLLLVRDKNVGLAAQYIIDQDTQAGPTSPAGATSTVGIINISFGGCEASATTVENIKINNMFVKAAAEGITITVSSGDAGANQVAASATAGCMSSSDQATQGDVASTGLAVNAFASSPYVLAVGGTDFDPNLEGTAGGAYWSKSNTSPTLYSTATHVPEMVWSTSCGNAEWSEYFAMASTLALCNQANLTTAAFGSIANPFIDVFGGGGGVSSCTSLNAGACVSGYAQPTWQQNVLGITNFGGRAVPDVSAIANRWIICSFNDIPCSAVPLKTLVSGTSAAAPVVAAIIALVDDSQKRAGTTFPDGRQGVINPLLYQLAAAEYASAANLAACNASQGAITSRACVFYDITLGSNAQPCSVASFVDTGSAPTSVCNNGGNAAFTTGLMTASSAGGPGSYPAGQGYDLASGLGSIDATNLVAAMSALAAPTGLTATAGAAGINLSWNADASAASFNVYQGTASGQEGASAVQTGITANSATVAAAGLMPGQTYFFEVAAVSGFGTSPNSNEASVMAVPAAPAGLSATAGNGTVALSWSAATGAASYNVYQGTSPRGEGAAPVTSVNNTTTTINALMNGTTYYFTVAGVDAGGASAPSNEANATPAAPRSGGGGGAMDWMTVVGLGVIATLRQRRRVASNLRQRPAHDL